MGHVGTILPRLRHRRRLHTGRVGECGGERRTKEGSHLEQATEPLARNRTSGNRGDDGAARRQRRLPAIGRRRWRDHRRRHVRRRSARAHRSGAQHDARRLPGDQRDVRRPDRDRLDRSGEHPDRPAARRVVRVQRGRHGVDVHDQGGPCSSPTASRSCRARSCARGSGRRTRTSPATTATCSTSSTVVPRSSPARRTRSPGSSPTTRR